jgi:uncharacterized HAD superfamily protein
MHRIPRDIDIVVGIPRSGMLPASLIALHRNLSLTDLDGFLEGRILQPGIRRKKPGLRETDPAAWKNVLVVDDSIGTGGTLAETRARLTVAAGDRNIFYCAVYGVKRRHPGVDLIMEVCPLFRAFEWNLMHHPFLLANTCLDIDGLLCVDPMSEENDDGPRYERFLQNAQPYLVPTVPVGTLVSSRLEKHRAMTEDWLHRHGIQFGELYLLDLPSAVARRRLKAHAPFKAEVYRSKKDAWLFLESNLSQAEAIAAQTGKAVICTTDMVLFDEHGARRAMRTIRRKIRKNGTYLSQLTGRLLGI